MKKILLLVLITVLVVVGCQVEPESEAFLSEIRNFTQLNFNNFTPFEEDEFIGEWEQFQQFNLNGENGISVASFIFYKQYGGFRKIIEDLSEVMVSYSLGSRESLFNFFINVEDELIEDYSTDYSQLDDDFFIKEAESVSYDVDYFDFGITGMGDDNDDTVSSRLLSSNYRVSYIDEEENLVEGIHSIYFANKQIDSEENVITFKYNETFGTREVLEYYSDFAALNVLTMLEVEETQELKYDESGNNDLDDALELISIITEGYILTSDWSFNEPLTEDRFNDVLKPILWNDTTTPKLSLTVSLDDGYGNRDTRTFTDWQVIELIRPLD